MDTSHILAGLEYIPSDIHPHIPELYRLAMNSTRLLELGVGDGVSTAALMCACYETGRRLFSVDSDDKEAGTRLYLRSLGLDDSLWTFIKGDVTGTGPVWKVRRSGPFDFIRVDTSHTFEGTTQRLAEYYPLLKPYGVMVFGNAHGSYTGAICGPIKEFLMAHPECRTVWDDIRGNGLIVLQRGR